MNNHLETTINIEVIEINKEWTVRYNSGVQTFGTNYFSDEKEDAEWYAETLRKFLNKQLVTSHINYLKRERDYWVKIFDSKPDRNKELIYDTVAQNFARIEIERKEEELSQAEQLLGNKE